MVIMLKTMTAVGEKGPANEQALETTFVQALQDKYVNQEVIDDKLCLPMDRTITTEITFVGFGKIANVQKQLKRLISIDLSSRRISSAGELGDLQDSLNRVQILNLANNLMHWDDIISIIPYVPNLRELIITNNRLGTIIEINCSDRNEKRNLRSLTTGHLDLDWESIIKVLSKIWISVDQLDLWASNLKSENMILSCPGTNSLTHFLQSLKILKLSHNVFPDLTWITRIGPIDHLIELDISHCHVKSIDIDVEVAKQLTFLEVLNISYNDIVDWKSISALHFLKNLSQLICLENPVYISEKFAKPFTIGRLGKIKLLNREDISTMQRRDSELLYFRKTFPEYQAFTQGENQNFKLNHPRYEELVEQYGIPEDLIKQKKVDKYITIDLCLDDKTITKKLPCDMRIVNVKMLCKRLFKLQPSSTIKITCCDNEASSKDLNYLLDKDGQTLHFFSVRNGHRLMIEVV